MKLHDLSTIKISDQDCTNPSTTKNAHHSTAPEQNHDQRTNQCTTEERTIFTRDELEEKQKSKLLQNKEAYLHNMASSHELLEFLKRKKKGSKSFPRIYYVSSERQISDELFR